MKQANLYRVVKQNHNGVTITLYIVATSIENVIAEEGYNLVSVEHLHRVNFVKEVQ